MKTMASLDDELTFVRTVCFHSNSSFRMNLGGYLE